MITFDPNFYYVVVVLTVATAVLLILDEIAKWLENRFK